jgi:hypothetical protein
MTSPLAYHAAHAHIDDLLREAATRQRVEEAAIRPRPRLTQMLRTPRRGLGSLAKRSNRRACSV